MTARWMSRLGRSLLGVAVLVCGVGSWSARAAAADPAVAAGYAHVCAVLATGAVQCWGSNTFGALGNGTTASSLAPVPVALQGGALAVAAGEGHSCAVLSDASVQCWGANTQGQLGNGTQNHSSTPVSVVGVRDAVGVTAGQLHSCALLQSGAVQCWGFNGNGRLGNGTAYSSTTAVAVTGISDAVSLSAGDAHTCAVLRAGNVLCWGFGGNARLGTAAMSSTLVPQPVVNVTGAQSVSAGFSHTCALLREGTVQCWGGDRAGLAGSNSAPASGPVTVTGLRFARSVSAGQHHTCVGADDGGVQCWGENAYGQLGNASTVMSSTPVDAILPSGVLAVAARVSYTCAQAQEGQVLCWGLGAQGQLAQGNTRNSSVALRVPWPSAGGATVTALHLVGPQALQSGGQANLLALAEYADTSRVAVQAVWTSSNPAAASVSRNGVLSAGLVLNDTQVSINARFTDGGVSVVASTPVLVRATPATLEALQLTDAAGARSLSAQSGGQLRLVHTARYADGSTRGVAPSRYSVSPVHLGSVDSRGILTLAEVSTTQPLTVTSFYTEGEVQVSAALQVAIEPTVPALVGLSIRAPGSGVAGGSRSQLAAMGLYADGSQKAVMPVWRSANALVTLATDGTLTASPVTQDTPVLITASYTHGGVSVAAQYQVVLLAASPVTAPIDVEVNASGLRSQYRLALWSQLRLALPSVRAAQTIPSYKLYVAALLPTGALVSTPTVFVLNRHREWQGLGVPLAEFLSGVSDAGVNLIELFEDVDVSLLSGTEIFVGYGIDESEMLEAGRYRSVYRIP